MAAACLGGGGIFFVLGCWWGAFLWARYDEDLDSAAFFVDLDGAPGAFWGFAEEAGNDDSAGLVGGDLGEGLFVTFEVTFVKH